MTRPAKLTPEERRAKERDRTRRWRLANPEKRRAQQKRDRDNHLEARRAAQRERDARAKGRTTRTPHVEIPRAVRIPTKGPAIRDCAKANKPEPALPCESTEDFIARHPERVERLPAPWTGRTGPTPCRYAVRGRGSQG